MIKALVTDIGNVVWNYEELQNQLLTRWAKLFNISPQAVHQKYDQIYIQFELGTQTLENYLLDLGYQPQPFLDILNQVFSATNFNQHLNHQVVDLITSLRSRNFIVGYLSNGENFKRDCIYRRLDHLFDFGITSYAAAFRKPDPKIYQLIFRHLSYLPEEIIFIDDKPENVRAAQELGINGIVFQNYPKLILDLKSLSPTLI
ncbi:hypothetical protein A3K55_00075 [Candidatus Shapirobacteria bacterium RBG_13_44_7]|uniref:Haloacid dehalogenase n=1 Tax=Candidatus Shapirobacteria bacterium RBG_13_44_7 TaxID=1802149 RepID=A0A1F7SEM7_9BACT|nr:MAG: hypothetical protein A3K55_00075 [Candidatus Shapirobacteria bacterium RBG_13_44_7]